VSEGISQLLARWGGGDQAALEQLAPLVYDELRRLARSHLRRERLNHTLQPTALVHEAWLRLIDQHGVAWQNRAQFFGLAAQMMRRILVDHVRRRRVVRREGMDYRVSLSRADRMARQPEVDLIALDEELTSLAALDPQKGRIVELRFFGGLTIEETAAVLGVSHARVEREWSVARAFLRRELSR
jgi:RNA polymerase sigma factor (TIGR02999 family)